MLLQFIVKAQIFCLNWFTNLYFSEKRAEMRKKVIKKVELSDLELLQKVAKETFQETFAKDNSERNMQKYLTDAFTMSKLHIEWLSPHSYFYFAFLDEEVVGYLKINEGNAQTESQDEGAFEIERIYVLQAYQREGIGQFLLDFALQFANENQAKYIWLGVWEKNTKAISFYQKNGFVAFDSHIFLFGDDPQTDILMKKSFE